MPFGFAYAALLFDSLAAATCIVIMFALIGHGCKNDDIEYLKDAWITLVVFLLFLMNILGLSVVPKIWS